MAKPKKVLIVDNDLKVSEKIKRAFDMDDEFTFEVTAVATEDKALEILKREGRFDLVIIDWGLEPIENGGMKILESLKTYLPKIKIIYTTYATLEDCVKAMKAGADDYIDRNQPEALKKLLDSAKEKLKARKFEEHEPDSRWLAEHIEELMDKYHGDLIAFIDGKVVGHAPTRRELMERVKKSYPDEEPFIMFAPMEVI